MSSLKNLAKETVIYGMSHILPRILHYIVMTVYITHRFNDDTIDYGIYSELYAYSTIILTVMLFRLDTAFFRFGSKSDNKDSVFSAALLPLLTLSILIGLCMLLFAEDISVFLSYPNQSHYVRWFALILGFDAIALLIYARFRLSNRPMKFLLFRVGNVLLTVFFVLFFLEILPRFYPDWQAILYDRLGMDRELDFVFFSNLLASFFILIFMLPEFLKVRIKIDFGLLKKMLLYAWPLVIVGLAGTWNQSGSLLLQKYWLSGSLEENQAMMGIFSAAAKLAILLNLFTTAFNYAAEPFFFNNAARGESKEVYGDVALAYTVFACIVSLGTYLFIDVIMLLIGENFRSGIYVVPVLLVAYIFLGLYYMVAIWYKLSDKTLVGAAVAIIGAIITLVISLALLPSLGIMASAMSSLVCYSFMVLICYQWSKKYHPITYPWSKISKIIGITIIVLAISYYLRLQLQEMKPILYISNVALFILGGGSILYSQRKFLLDVIKSKN